MYQLESNERITMNFQVMKILSLRRNCIRLIVSSSGAIRKFSTRVTPFFTLKKKYIYKMITNN